MGFRPEDIDRMSLWEFMACIEGYAAAHGDKKSGRRTRGDLSDVRLREMGVVGF